MRLALQRAIRSLSVALFSSVCMVCPQAMAANDSSEANALIEEKDERVRARINAQQEINDIGPQKKRKRLLKKQREAEKKLIREQSMDGQTLTPPQVAAESKSREAQQDLSR